MLNKTNHTIFLSDNEIHNFDEKYEENDLLSKYLLRQNIDILKETNWFLRRKKWNIAFQHRDLLMIRRAIRNHPQDWHQHIADTIQLSESRYWTDWLLTEAYESWIKEHYGELTVLKNKQQRYQTEKKQLRAMIHLYKINVSISGNDIISQTEKKLSECDDNIKHIENKIKVLSNAILFTQRDLYDAFRAIVYRHNSLQGTELPDEFRTLIHCILSLKENGDDHLYQWLYQKNICLKNDTLCWS